MTEFQHDLEKLLKQHSKDNEAETPDFILAEYLRDCLNAFTNANKKREVHFGRKHPTHISMPKNAKP